MAVAATTPPWQHIAKITWAGPEGGFQFTGFEASERGYVLNPGTVAAAFNAIAWTLDADGDVIRQPWAQGYVASLDIPTLDRDDIVQASNQADEIAVGPGDDKVYARGGDDVVDGGGGDDELHGEGGDDTLVGGDGNDTFAGGAGEDRFVVLGSGEPFGLDEILDFQPGADAIELRGFAGLDDFGDLAGAIAEVGNDTVIDLSGAFGAAPGTAAITVADVLGLAAGDFVFSAATS
jgi:Ca2+-binding RTX toxin-like protein